MTLRPVQSVFFWRADMATPFRAVYGRVQGSNLYSKDFHQMAEPAAIAMERAFGLPRRGQTSVTWVWPNGQRAGTSQFKAGSSGDSRSRLHWPYAESPDIWRVTPKVTQNTLQCITGEPGTHGDTMDAAEEAHAEQQRQRVDNDDERPWYLAVHLHGDGPVLHARTVLENPDPGHEFASWDNLPERLRDAMAVMRNGRDATGFVEFEESKPMAAGGLVEEILTAFEDNPNVLLVGPPGTGKTVAMEAIREMYEGKPTDSVMFDADEVHDAFEVVESDFDGDQAVRSIVFHPSYAYEHFVMGLLPDLDEDSKQVVVKPHVGPLLEMAHFASGEDRRALLILDEFNRAPASAVFGDTLALLDADKRVDPDIDGSGSRISTPYAHLNPVTADGDPLDTETTFPKNLRILAAMNSADRSVAPLDAALRRRFAIIHVDPDYQVLEDHLDVAEDFDPAASDSWTEPEVATLAVAILRALNRRIEMIEGRDFLLGQSLFWKVEGEDRDSALASLAVALDNRVIGTLALTFTDNDDALAAVLNMNSDSGGLAAKWVEPEPGLAGVAMRRLRPVRFQSLAPDDLIAALKSLL